MSGAPREQPAVPPFKIVGGPSAAACTDDGCALPGAGQEPEAPAAEAGDDAPRAS